MKSGKSGTGQIEGHSHLGVEPYGPRITPSLVRGRGMKSPIRIAVASGKGGPAATDIRALWERVRNAID